MRIIVTAGPTREYIDSVRFITNASSGKMGCAIAQSAATAGHQITLLLGPGVSSDVCPDVLSESSSSSGVLASTSHDESGGSACKYARPTSSGVLASARHDENDSSACRYARPTSAEHGEPDTRGNIKIIRFVSVADLKAALQANFPACDALVMTAAVGDFRVDKLLPGKISRSAGPITITLVPTEDVLASVASAKTPSQVIVGFAVETGPRDQIELKARRELAAKNADVVVVNMPEAMAADASEAAILSPTATLLPWAMRPKKNLADEIIKLLTQLHATATNS